MLPLMLLFLFVVVPLAMGYVVPGAMTARVAWLAFGAVLAYSQGRDDDLGGAWVLVALVTVFGLLFVEIGHRVRVRETRG